MLTGESRFHISTPLGIEPGSLMTGSKGWTTGPVELCLNAVRLQALHSMLFLKILDQCENERKVYLVLEIPSAALSM
jgi:hypothetical protein